MKPSIFQLVLATSIITLAILFITWWINGRDDTWFYFTCAVIVLSSFLYVKPPKKNKDQ